MLPYPEHWPELWGQLAAVAFTLITVSVRRLVGVTFKAMMTTRVIAGP